MEAAATKKEYEKAAVIRDRLIALEHINQVNILQKEQERQFQNPLTTLVRLLSRYYPTLRLHPGFRIEAYDISHFGGSATTGSMIVFQNGEKEPSEYRMFKIKTSPQSDDIAAMTEVLSRRLQHREWIMPDLILIDGGKGQLKAGFLVQEKFLLNIPYLALAKKEEKIYLPGRSNPLQLEEDSPALLLLREIRDEAHRFAKQYHLKLRSKQFLKPSLKPILKR
jgi:excinuclease UvrABC nuclease subunit